MQQRSQSREWAPASGRTLEARLYSMVRLGQSLLVHGAVGQRSQGPVQRSREWLAGLVAGILNRLYEVARTRLRDAYASEPRGPGSTPPRDTPEDQGGAPRHEQVFTDQEDPFAQYYANLEIPQGSDLNTARRAWKRLMKRYHPDLHSGDPERVKVANELSAKLTEAYRALEVKLSGGEAGTSSF